MDKMQDPGAGIHMHRVIDNGDNSHMRLIDLSSTLSCYQRYRRETKCQNVAVSYQKICHSSDIQRSKCSQVECGKEHGSKE